MYLGGDPTKAEEGFLIVSGQKFFPNFAELIGAVIDFLIKLVGTIALVLIVVSGFRLVVSAGNDNAITKSKDMLKFAIIGLVVSLLAYIIVAAIRGLVYR
ncbi:MAG: hypothetical protein ACD_65C00179G0001 [uncultured bacterium]|nr:MAG: hypothetical protein ACD_65C00179G0001 [uncultured bacterium]